MKHKKPILVTKPYFPSLKKYGAYLQQIWKNGWLTNNGPLVRKLEQKLSTYLGVKHVLFVSSGTMALQLAIKSLEMKPGEIITTPLSFVATTTAIIAEGFTPVFVDIDVDDYSLNPREIEKAITKKTRAIMPVHVYGYPCNVKAIEKLAKKHNLKVIYDAAHAFGTAVDGVSVMHFGNVSTLSFHATKLFHTGEGGAVVTDDDALAEKVKLYRSFGFVGDDHYLAGINGKNSEIHAALGLANLPHIKRFITQRQTLSALYDRFFEKTRLYIPCRQETVNYNFAYYPVLFKNEKELLQVKAALEKEQIYPRRYFYPSLNTLSYVKGQSCPIAETVSERILCLPLYNGLKEKDVQKIAEIVVNNLVFKTSLRANAMSAAIPPKRLLRHSFTRSSQ